MSLRRKLRFKWDVLALKWDIFLLKAAGLPRKKRAYEVEKLHYNDVEDALTSHPPMGRLGIDLLCPGCERVYGQIPEPTPSKSDSWALIICPCETTFCGLIPWRGQYQ